MNIKSIFSGKTKFSGATISPMDGLSVPKEQKTPAPTNAASALSDILYGENALLPNAESIIERPSPSGSYSERPITRSTPHKQYGTSPNDTKNGKKLNLNI